MDELVLKLVGQKQRVLWKKLGDSIPLGGSVVTMSKESDKLHIENVGCKSCLVKYGKISVTDDPMLEGEALCTDSSEVLPQGKQVTIQIISNTKYLRIYDENNVIIIEIK